MLITNNIFIYKIKKNSPLILQKKSPPLGKGGQKRVRTHSVIRIPLTGSDKGDLIPGIKKNLPKRLFLQLSVSRYSIAELLIARYFYKCARIALPISTIWIIHSYRSLSGLCKRHRSNGTPKYLALSVGFEPTVHCNLREEAKAHTPPVAKDSFPQDATNNIEGNRQ
jgi:hypothetical protein